MNSRLNIDRNKIRLMAKMALYDKKGFEKDAQANEYFRHDFIYKRNMSMRFHVGIGLLILVVFYFLRLLSLEDGDVFALDFQVVLVQILVFAVIVMVGYSLIGTIIFTREFLVSEKRVKAYFSLMRELHGEPDEDEGAAPAAAEPEEEEEEYVIFRPYRSRVVDTTLTYNYPSTDDPQLWEEEGDNKK